MMMGRYMTSRTGLLKPLTSEELRKLNTILRKALSDYPRMDSAVYSEISSLRGHEIYPELTGRTDWL